MHYVVIPTVPDLVATHSSIFVLPGENVTIGCDPSDSSLALEWIVSTRQSSGFERIPPVVENEGSGDIVIDDEGFDEEGSTGTGGNSLRKRLEYELPLIHQITITNTLITDSGYIICSIKAPPNDNTNIFQEVEFNVLPSKYSSFHLT